MSITCRGPTPAKPFFILRSLNIPEQLPIHSPVVSAVALDSSPASASV